MDSDRRRLREAIALLLASGATALGLYALFDEEPDPAEHPILVCDRGGENSREP